MFNLSFSQDSFIPKAIYNTLVKVKNTTANRSLTEIFTTQRSFRITLCFLSQVQSLWTRYVVTYVTRRLFGSIYLDSGQLAGFGGSDAMQHFSGEALLRTNVLWKSTKNVKSFAKCFFLF